MIWFRNLETGQEWNVSDPNLIERLSKDPAYQEIPDPKVKPKPVKATSKKAEKPSDK